LKTINSFAFYGTKPIAVDFSNSPLLTTIANHVFYSNNSLMEVKFNSNNLNIGSYAFNANKIASLEILGDNITIQASAFESNLIEEMNIPGKVIAIGNDAFKNNQLPDDKAFIYGRNADGTTNSTLVSYAGANRSNITIPDSITSLDNATFNSLGLSGTLNTGNGLTTVASSKFANNSLTNIVLGSSITTIASIVLPLNALVAIVAIEAGNVAPFRFLLLKASELIAVIVTPSNLSGISGFKEQNSL
jgi:hypothetical protein